MRSIAIEVVYECELIGITKGITLESFGESIEGPGKHHCTIADFIFFARQAESVNLDGILAQAFVVKGVSVFGEVDMFKGSDNKTNVLWKDGCVAGETRSFSCRIGRIENL